MSEAKYTAEQNLVLYRAALTELVKHCSALHDEPALRAIPAVMGAARVAGVILQDEDADIDLPRISDADIDAIAHSLPFEGFTKNWGWRDFAREVEKAVYRRLGFEVAA